MVIEFAMIILHLGHLGYDNSSSILGLKWSSGKCLFSILITTNYLFIYLLLQVNGHGIDSMSKLFLDFGFEQREELRFPAKKLKAFWFSPPKVSTSCRGSGVNGPLPRIFISELLVDQLSPEAQVFHQLVALHNFFVCLTEQNHCLMDEFHISKVWCFCSKILVYYS